MLAWLRQLFCKRWAVDITGLSMWSGPFLLETRTYRWKWTASVGEFLFNCAPRVGFVLISASEPRRIENGPPILPPVTRDSPPTFALLKAFPECAECQCYPECRMDCPDWRECLERLPEYKARCLGAQPDNALSK